MYFVLLTFHIHRPLLWITRWWVGSVILTCILDIPILQSITIGVCIFFAYFPYIHCLLLWITRRWVGSVMCWCVLLISLLSNPLKLMFVSCFAYFPYLSFLMWITSKWVGSVMLTCIVDIHILRSIEIDTCIWFSILYISIILYYGLLESELVNMLLISLLSNPLKLIFALCFAYFPYPSSSTVDY